MPREVLGWGSVKIVDGKYKGRIGYYDDDEDKFAIVYFGDMLICNNYYFIPHEFLAPITTEDLMKRRDEIFQLIGMGSQLTCQRYVDLLREFSYIESELYERLFKARFAEKIVEKSVFISYSSLDRQFATWISVDLANVGHKPWLDEWEIRAGESMPKKVAEGINLCDFVVVILSEHAIKSKWVETEWYTKYFDEINDGRIRVIPILYKDCEIPTLLKNKKYADFRRSYNNGFQDLLLALKI